MQLLWIAVARGDAVKWSQHSEFEILGKRLAIPPLKGLA